MRISIKETKILVVEGRDEEMFASLTDAFGLQFFSALMAHLSLMGIQILPIGGKTQLRSNLKALKATPGFTNIVSLGIIRDADTNATSAFQSVCGALQAANLSIPEQMLVATGTSPQVAVMILPNGKASGMLEDLCLAAVVNDPAMPCVEQYFDCVQKQVGFLPRNISKAKIHTFLSSKVEPDKRLGEAAQAGYWPWDNAAFDQIKQFLRLL